MAIDYALLGSFLLLRSLARLSFAALIMDFAQFDLTLLVRNSLHSDPTLPASDSVHLGSALTLQVLAYLKSCTFVTDHTYLDSAPSLQSSTQPRPAVIAFRIANSDLVLVILDSFHLDVSVTLRNYAQLELPLLIIELAIFGSSMTLHFSSCLESAVLVLNSALLNSSVSLHSHAQLSSSAFVSRISRLDSPIVVPDSGHADALSAVQSSNYSDFASLLFGVCQAESLLIACFYGLMGSLVSIRSHMGLDLATPTMSCVKADTSLAALDLLHPGSFSFLQIFAQSRSPTLFSGCCRFGLSVLVVDGIHTDSLLLSRVFTHIGSPLLFPGYSQPCFVPSIRSSARTASSSSLIHVARSRSSMLLLDPVHLELLPTLRISPHLNSATMVTDLLQPEISMLTRTNTHLGLMLFTTGLA